MRIGQGIMAGSGVEGGVGIVTQFVRSLYEDISGANL